MEYKLGLKVKIKMQSVGSRHKTVHFLKPCQCQQWYMLPNAKWRRVHFMVMQRQQAKIEQVAWNDPRFRKKNGAQVKVYHHTNKLKLFCQTQTHHKLRWLQPHNKAHVHDGSSHSIKQHMINKNGWQHGLNEGTPISDMCKTGFGFSMSVFV